MKKLLLILTFAIASITGIAYCGNLSRAELEKLVQNPTADFSQFDRSTIEQLAHLDAKAYVKANPGKKLTENQARDIGESRAFKHNLIGNHTIVYRVGFKDAILALQRPAE